MATQFTSMNEKEANPEDLTTFDKTNLEFLITEFPKAKLKLEETYTKYNEEKNVFDKIVSELEGLLGLKMMYEDGDQEEQFESMCRMATFKLTEENIVFDMDSLKAAKIKLRKAENEFIREECTFRTLKRRFLDIFEERYEWPGSEKWIAKHQ